MISLAVDKVEQHTNPEINKRIHRQTDRSISYFKYHKDEVGERLQELEQEWSTDRVLQTAAGAIALASAVLTVATNNKRFTIMSAVSGSFLLMYSIMGWAPPFLSCGGGEYEPQPR
jgi:hypothetical protein